MRAMAMKNLLRAPLRAFKPYVAGKPIDEVRREYGLTGRIAKMASNENPLGTSPKALEAMRKAIEEVYLYPDDNSYYLRRKIAEKHDVSFENVFAASGSVEVLELTAQAFLEPADGVVTSEHTFAIYMLAALKVGAQLRMAPMIDGGYRYDVPAIGKLVDDRTKVVFLANPTNPTGTWFSGEEFDAFMAGVPEDVLVVYDSAYAEYCPYADMPDPMKHFRAGRRILCLRTFSKAYGLAGMRVGYAIGPTDIIHGLMTCRVAFNLNLVAQAGAMAALDDDEFVRRSREFNDRELAFLREGMDGLPVVIPPSRANFLLVDTKKSAQWLFEELQKRGIIVRPMAGYGYPGAVRVNPWLREDNERFLTSLKELLSSDRGEL
jgi:histidinol-phosphate aminotransferase